MALHMCLKLVVPYLKGNEVGVQEMVSPKSRNEIVPLKPWEECCKAEVKDSLAQSESLWPLGFLC